MEWLEEATENLNVATVWMINEKGYKRKQLWHLFRKYSSTCLEWLKKTTDSLILYAESLSQDLNP
jgi:hypothetical protein